MGIFRKKILHFTEPSTVFTICRLNPMHSGLIVSLCWPSHLYIGVA